MKPANNGKSDYEKVDCGDFIPGTISDIQYDKEHTFKGFNGGEDAKHEAVRFIFLLDGYKMKHYSRWMKFIYAEKSNLYSKYLVPLVMHPEPFMDFEIELLKGMKVKTLWTEKNDFQNIETIRPVGEKIFRPLEPETPEEAESLPSEQSKADDLPF
jgi:hypothetical protein